MTTDELLRAINISEANKKTIVCNSNTAEILKLTDIGKKCNIVISPCTVDNQVLVYDNPMGMEFLR